MTIAEINTCFGIKESFELPSKLMEMLMNKEAKDILCEKFIDVGIDLKHDVLRDYFQETGANRSDLKQDYTPDCVCELLSRLAPETTNLLDVCSGTGSLTLSFMNKDNKQRYYQLEELSARSIPILLFNIIIRNISAIVLQSDVLKNDILHIYKITQAEKFSDIAEVDDFNEPQFDVAISNPPYSLPWEPKEDDRFKGYALAPKSKADYAFVLDILYRLSDKGKAFILLPTGVLFRSNAEGQIRQQLIDNHLIDAVICLPEKLFLNTAIPVLILILNKSKTNNDILFIDSSKEFVKGTKQNSLSEENINKIIQTYSARIDVDKFSHVATLDEIKKNDYNLNPPRYVDTYEKEVLPPISEILDNIVALEKEYHDNIVEFSSMISELEATDRGCQKDVDNMKEKYKILETFDNETSWDDFIKTTNKLTDSLSTAQKVTYELSQLSTIERAVKGKLYKRGCLLLQISATNGEFIYLTEDKEIESKYAVIIPNPDITSKYLYYSISANLEEYLHKVQQDMNIAFKDVLKIPVVYYADKVIQDQIVAIMTMLNDCEEHVTNSMEKSKEEKKFMLDQMFI